jgi:hypothetical protein
MSESNPNSTVLRPCAIITRTRETAASSPPATAMLTPDGAAAAELARNASAQATLGQKGNWVVMASWLAQLRPLLLLPDDIPAPKGSRDEAERVRNRLSGLAKTRVSAELQRVATADWDARDGYEWHVCGGLNPRLFGYFPI